METEKVQTLPPPPGVIGSLRAGFDAIASNLAVISLPLALDVLLWLGPRLRIDQLFKPMFDELSRYTSLSGLPTAEVTTIQKTYAEFLIWLQQFNLLSLLRTFPVGIFSLMSGKMPVTTPLGLPAVIQVESLITLLGWMVLLTLIGWFCGGMFFSWVSTIVIESPEPGLYKFGPLILQTILFSILWVMLLAVVGTPTMVILALLVAASPLIAQGILLLTGLLSIWLIVPAFFTPHGIYVNKQNAFVSIYASLKMARFTLPTSSLFVMSVLLIAFGLNFLWSIPSTDSWMTLVGIAGHAFITTSLLAASFIYYRDMHAWLQTIFEKLKATDARQQA